MNAAEFENRNIPVWRRVLIGKNSRKILVRLIAIGVVSFVIFKYWLLPMWVVGISMEPTYRNGGFVFMNALAYKWNEPKRGDVIGVRLTGNHVQYLKRVVGLPGEKIEIMDGIVKIDGNPLDETYVVNSFHWTLEPILVPQDNYFVVGDNRDHDPDGHSKGIIPKSKIVGKTLW